MSFTDKTAIAYKAIITSFNDDFYHGTFYRVYEGNLKEFLGNFQLDFDDQDEEFPHSYFYFTTSDIKYDRQVFIDFEVDEIDRGISELEDVVSNIVMRSAHQIHRALKIDGIMLELEIV